jgi:hypothetical protein
MSDARGPHQLSADLSMCKHCGMPRPADGFPVGLKCYSNMQAAGVAAAPRSARLEMTCVLKNQVADVQTDNCVVQLDASQ